MRRTIKTGPKRLRRTRRELPLGQRTLWGKSTDHARQERKDTRLRLAEATREAAR